MRAFLDRVAGEAANVFAVAAVMLAIYALILPLLSP